jgi:IclR family acetate operon transcriptional repressor
MENISGTVNKAIDILDAFLQGTSSMTLTEVSNITGYNPATTYRLLATLVGRGLLRQEKKKGKYALAPKTAAYGFVMRTNLNYLDTLYYHLSRLCREQKVDANATLLSDNTALVIDEFGVANDFRITALVGKRLPLHATAAGKVHLAFMSPEERRAFFEIGPLQRLTPRTLTSFEQLEKELEVIRREGIAFDQEEHITGTWAVASPLYAGKDSLLATASVVVPVSRVDAYRSQQLASALRNCAAEISLVLSRAGKS